MRIVVCIKQVPVAGDARIDPSTRRIVREGLKSMMNPFDLYAIEEGIRLREKFGGEVVALSMGPAKAQEILREAISTGADRAILLSDKAFGGSDTWATSYVLANAIKKIGNADLVICGKQAIDGDTAQVGPGIAAHLDWPQAACITMIDKVTADTITVRRLHEDGYDVCELDFPAVLTVTREINTPRLPSLKGLLVSRKCSIPVWKPSDIGVETNKTGLAGSPTMVVRTTEPKPRNSVTKRIEGSPGECARELVRELRLRRIL